MNILKYKTGRREKDGDKQWFCNFSHQYQKSIINLTHTGEKGGGEGEEEKSKLLLCTQTPIHSCQQNIYCRKFLENNVQCFQL